MIRVRRAVTVVKTLEERVGNKGADVNVCDHGVEIWVVSGSRRDWFRSYTLNVPSLRMTLE